MNVDVHPINCEFDGLSGSLFVVELVHDSHAVQFEVQRLSNHCDSALCYS